MLADSLRRGLAAGLVAGLLAGAFALLLGEVPVREAVRLEEQAASTAPTTADATASDAGADTPAIDRTTQQALLPVATALVGASLGGLFGLAWAFARRRIDDRSDWRASWRLGAATWAAVALVPALAAPPNPPAVGDPATIGARSGWYLASIGIALLVAGVLWALATRLRTSTDLPAPARQVLVGTLALAAVIALVLLAPAPDAPAAVPARLLWDFRLASMGTQLLLWAGIAAVNGWLWHRATAPATTDRTVPA